MIKIFMLNILRNRVRTLILLGFSFFSFLICFYFATNIINDYLQVGQLEAYFGESSSDLYVLKEIYVEDDASAGEDINYTKETIKSHKDILAGGFEQTDAGIDELSVDWRDNYNFIFTDPEYLDIIGFSVSGAELLPFVLDGVTYLPAFVSGKYKDIFEKDQIYTIDRTGAKIIIKGTIENEKWLDGFLDGKTRVVDINDSILVSFPDVDKTDNMTQLSTTGCYYIKGNVDASLVEEIERTGDERNIKYVLDNVGEIIREQEARDKDTAGFQIKLAINVLICSALTEIAIILAFIFLGQEEFGIKMAFGNSKKQIIAFTITEYLSIMGLAFILSFITENKLISNEQEFMRAPLKSTFYHWATPLVLCIVILTTICISIPSIIYIKKYNPCEIMRDVT